MDVKRVFAAKILFIGLLVTSWTVESARAADRRELAAAIKQLVTSPKVGGMRVGVHVEELGDNPAIIYQQHAEELFKPASNMKIVTTAAAMCVMSPEFTYRTVLGVRGEDLVIIGSGDPSTGDPKMAAAAREDVTATFQEWARQLKARGITSIRGRLLFDDFIFEQEHLHPGWPRQFNLQNWYAAPVGGLNFNDNCVEVVIKPSKEGEPADVRLVPASSYMSVDNRTRTAAKGEPIINRQTTQPTTITVSGSVSRGNTPADAPSISVPDPGFLFASACRAVFEEQGIRIDGPTARARVRQQDLSLPPDLKVVAVSERKLKDVFWRINKSSLNMFAEAVFKTMGAYAGRENAPVVGTYDNGRQVIERFLGRIGISPESYRIDDGSGLSHDNRVTPLMLATILRYMNSHPRSEEWWANLAVPQESVGTLRRRMKDLEGKVFAKTGSIGGVSSLSGYVKADNGRRYIFSVLCNDIGKTKGLSPHTIQDEVCRILAGRKPATSTSQANAVSKARRTATR